MGRRFKEGTMELYKNHLKPHIEEMLNSGESKRTFDARILDYHKYYEASGSTATVRLSEETWFIVTEPSGEIGYNATAITPYSDTITGINMLIGVAELDIIVDREMMNYLREILGIKRFTAKTWGTLHGTIAKDIKVDLSVSIDNGSICYGLSLDQNCPQVRAINKLGDTPERIARVWENIYSVSE